MKIPDEVFIKLLYNAQSTQDVKNILSANNLLDRDLWKPIGGDYTNETMIRGQSPSPELALGERCINSVDSILMRKCIENEIDPWGLNAPKSMVDATAKCTKIPEGKLSKYEGNPANICEIFCTATGREEGKITLNLVDFGEGQTPDYMKHSFLSLPTRGKPYKLGIPFVQGRYNQGSSGSYKFSEFTLIVTRRAPSLLSDESRQIIDKTYDSKKTPLEEIYKRKDEWGWTLVTKFPRKNSNEVTWYGYLAPDGQIQSVKFDTLSLIPPEKIPIISDNLSSKRRKEELRKLRQQGTRLAYSQPVQSATLIKLFDFPLKSALNADLWSQGARAMRAEVFYELPFPIRMTELREYEPRIKGKGDSSYLVGLLNSILRANKAKSKLVRKGWPKDEYQEISINDKKIGKIFISKWILETSKGDSDQSENWLGNNSIVYVLNGQVHYRERGSFLSQLKLYNLEGSLLVAVDVNEIPIDVRDKIFRVDRAFLEDTPETAALVDAVRNSIINDEEIKKVNDEKFYEKSADVDVDTKITEKIFQKLTKDNPLMRELLLGTNISITSGDTILVKRKGEQYRNIKYGVPSPTFFKLKEAKKA